MLVNATTNETIDLDEFLAFLDANLDPNSESSILRVAPKLLALSRNRAFLANLLRVTLPHPHFQQDTPYIEPVFVLATGAGYMVRAVAWKPQKAGDPRDNAAHNHTFSLLTVGYFGPGYETDMYECEPETIRATGAISGAVTSLRFIGRFRLAEGTLLYYPPHRVAHRQYSPSQYSVSLNLIVRNKHDELADQYFFDPDASVLTGSRGGANDKRIGLLQLAAAAPNPAYVPHLEQIAASHTEPRIRRAAADALKRSIAV